MSRNSSFQFTSLPPWHIPFRFFLTAPLFAMLAGGYLLWLGGKALDPQLAYALWQSRWDGYVLAALHLFTIGFITMIMCGALLQIISVLSGKRIPGLGFVAAVAHIALSLGCCSFWGAHAGLFTPPVAHVLSGVAVFSILLAITLLALSVLGVLVPAAMRASAMRGTLMAVVALLGAIALGGSLMPGVAPDSWGVSRLLTNVHIMWVLAGWVGMLIVSVSAQVIPRFFLTTPFPVMVTSGLPVWVLLHLMAYSIALLSALPIMAAVAKWGLLVAYSFFALLVLHRLHHRKRDTDVFSMIFWQYAAIGYLIFFLGQFTLSLGQISPNSSATLEMISMVFLLFAAVLSVLIAMLLRIIPFLSYLHMQRFCRGNNAALQRLPKASTVLKTAHVKCLLWLHPGVVISLVAMVLSPRLTVLAGLLVVVQFGLLFLMVLRAVQMIQSAQADARE